MSTDLIWQVRRTDRRMNGFIHFDYVANPSITKYDLLGAYNKKKSYKLALIETRKWCWDTWGASCELSFFMQLQNNKDFYNDRWCWHTEFDSYKIYLKSDKEANWFKLKWQ